MKGWHLGLAALAVIGLAAFVGVPYGRAIKYQFACEETVHKVGRFPTAEQVLALKPALEAQAQPHGVDPKQVQVQVGLRSLDGGGARLYYVRAEVRHGGRYHSHEQLIDSGKVTRDFLDALREGGGILISGGGATFADAPPAEGDGEE
ncbi:MAG: hypothetical protein KDD82_01430 [Planctomycetes bacterium]|nr:hypothetical protein [Planctomycetota bacterium]